jgi:hypothetical protein
MNRLYAAGAFEARCPSTITAPSSISAVLGGNLLGGTQLYVTVPASLPAQRIMPGFDQVPGGTTLNCSYNWTSDAEESTYSDQYSRIRHHHRWRKGARGSSVPFEMYQPGSSGSDDNNGCIH